jgi:probable F420-dependent oxidoreductase
MRFGIMLANTGPFSLPDHFELLVRSAEELGFESIWTAEHVLVPVGYQSRYPYSKNGRMPGGETVPIPDPFLPLAFAAAITRTVRLGTGVLILPQRHPAYVAKEVATLDVLSGGRMILGVGVGWLEEESAAVNVPFKERGARTNEAIQAIRSLWKPEPEAFAGRFYRWGEVQSQPKPVQARGVPIVVGGHSHAAVRRAARHGDGFFPGLGEPAALADLLGRLRDECRAIGRDPADIELTLALRSWNLDLVRRYQELGVSRLNITPPTYAKDELRAELTAFADRIMSKV